MQSLCKFRQKLSPTLFSLARTNLRSKTFRIYSSLSLLLGMAVDFHSFTHREDVKGKLLSSL